MEELLYRGKTKTSPGFLASVNAEFSSKKMEFPLKWKKISQRNLGEFNETNFENSCFSWEFSFLS